MLGAATAGQGAGDQFLQAAQGFTGPQAYQQFMSPYQQEVIDTTLAQMDQDAARTSCSNLERQQVTLLVVEDLE